MDKLDYDLYIIAELRYKKEYSNKDDDDIFPIDWYSKKDYKLKTKIIAEAIKTNTLIENTNLYQTQFVEKIKED